MAFSIFCILESIVLVMNAFAILNDRFLRKGKLCIFMSDHVNLVNLSVEHMNNSNNNNVAQDQQNNIGESSSKQQVIVFLSLRKYMRCNIFLIIIYLFLGPLIALNGFFILMELLIG